MDILKEISEALIDGNSRLVSTLVQNALDDNIEALDILNKGLIAGMDEIGKLWNDGEIFIPEVLVAARAMNSGSKMIEEALFKDGFKASSTAVIGTVKGDLHDIGKNLVGMMLKGKGINVIDLGVDVTKEQYYEAAVKHQAKFIVCSSLLTTTMIYMKDIVNYFTEKGMREQVVIACGGAPVTQSFASQAGADVYAEDAVKLAKIFLSMTSEVSA